MKSGELEEVVKRPNVLWRQQLVRFKIEGSCCIQLQK